VADVRRAADDLVVLTFDAPAAIHRSPAARGCAERAGPGGSKDAWEWRRIIRWRRVTRARLTCQARTLTEQVVIDYDQV
jgi:hypothetical protein